MPSFDVVSKVDEHELANAVDQANREIQNRFDFKGADASFKIDKESVLLKAPSEFQVQQMDDILRAKLVKREIDTRSLDPQKVEINGMEARQTINVVQGITTENAKKIVKLIKDKKMKVQASIQGDQVRVTGKKRDDLQAVMGLLRECELELALQFDNFRD
jgi:uncharacterized protein YajQ (UPF0234 family)